MNNLFLSRNKKNYLAIKIKHKRISNNIALPNLLWRVEELGTNIRFRYDSTSDYRLSPFHPLSLRRKGESLESRLGMTDFAVFFLRLLSSLTYSTCVIISFDTVTDSLFKCVQSRRHLKSSNVSVWTAEKQGPVYRKPRFMSLYLKTDKCMRLSPLV